LVKSKKLKYSCKFTKYFKITLSIHWIPLELYKNSAEFCVIPMVLSSKSINYVGDFYVFSYKIRKMSTLSSTWYLSLNNFNKIILLVEKSYYVIAFRHFCFTFAYSTSLKEIKNFSENILGKIILSKNPTTKKHKFMSYCTINDICTKETSYVLKSKRKLMHLTDKVYNFIWF
jgi:hypothetical protein